MWTNITAKLESWLNTFMAMLPNILIALAILIGSYFISRYVKKLTHKLLGAISENKSVNKLIANGVTVAFLIAAIFISLGVLNLDKTLTSLLAGAGIAGLALALAFQEPIMNTVSGVILAIRKAFKHGDIIETNGYMGVVELITTRDTTIHLFTGEKVFIPNKLIVQNPITNHTVNGSRRIDISCGVSYDDDLEKAEKIAIQAIKDLNIAMPDKNIECFYDAFGASSIDFKLRFWISEMPQKELLAARSKAVKGLKKAFDEAGINIPFPIRTVHLTKSS